MHRLETHNIAPRHLMDGRVRITHCYRCSRASLAIGSVAKAQVSPTVDRHRPIPWGRRFGVCRRPDGIRVSELDRGIGSASAA